MTIYFDQQHILCAGPVANEQKRYRYTVGGYSFEDFNKEILIYNKRQWRLIQLKDFSEGMQVAIAVKRNTALPFTIDEDQFGNVLSLFSGFDEESGQHYHFLPFCNHSPAHLNELCKSYGLTCTIEKTSQGLFIRNLDQKFSIPTTLDQQLGFLFSLVLLYGKSDRKGEHSTGIKIHFPLFGIWNRLEDDFFAMIQHLQQIGLFISPNIHEQGNKKTLELSSNDFELLELFTHSSLNKGKNQTPSSRSPLNIKNNEIVGQLLDFLGQNFSAQDQEFLKTFLDAWNLLKFLKY